MQCNVHSFMIDIFGPEHSIKGALQVAGFTDFASLPDWAEWQLLSHHHREMWSCWRSVDNWTRNVVRSWIFPRRVNTETMTPQLLLTTDQQVANMVSSVQGRKYIQKAGHNVVRGDFVTSPKLKIVKSLEIFSQSHIAIITIYIHYTWAAPLRHNGKINLKSWGKIIKT